MGHRSYLYATDRIPVAEASGMEIGLLGISEWSDNVPIVHKLLLSGNPTKCNSSIFECGEVAIAGEYDLGTQRLMQFLDRISNPLIAPLRDEARQFLSDPSNRRRYFVLEIAEVFDGDDEELREVCDNMIADIKDLGPDIEATLADIDAPAPEKPRRRGLFRSLFSGKSSPPENVCDPGRYIESLGLGAWSNILYYDFSGAD